MRIENQIVVNFGVDADDCSPITVGFNEDGEFWLGQDDDQIIVPRDEVHGFVGALNRFVGDFGPSAFTLQRGPFFGEGG
jgi:hypothetical protein